MADGPESDEENFEDALEIVSVPSEMDLEQSLEATTAAMSLFLNNKFSESLAKMKPWADVSIYHAVGSATIMYFQAVMTFESRHIEAAIEVIKRAVNVCNSQRRKVTITDSLAKMVKGSNYDLYSDVEVHAELCYAECLLQRALLTFIQDENLVSFIRGGLKIRTCYQSYKECLQILRQRTWNDKDFKTHFESGVRMGVGAFNLLISCLPSRILKLLEFMGFSGSRTVGLRQLEKGYRMKPAIRSPLCGLILLTYHTYVTYFTGMGDGDLNFASDILSSMLQSFPNGVLFLFFCGRIQEIKGNMDDAILWLEQAVESQREWKQFHHLCYWELMWCHTFKCDWKNAAHYADLLIKESRWSRTTYCYQKAAFMCMIYDELTDDQRENLNKLMIDIPVYKQRIAGKSLPMEKFAVKKSERFFEQGSRLTVPALELLYVWNAFPILGKKLSLVDTVYVELERTEKLLEANSARNPMYMDDYCLVQLLKGMCLKHMDSPLQAEVCLKNVWQNEKKIKEDLYLVPYSLVELGLLELQKENYTEAREYLETARVNYKGYSLESRLHFKIHSGMTLIKAKTTSTTSTTTNTLTLGDTPPVSLTSSPSHSPDFTPDNFQNNGSEQSNNGYMDIRL